MAGEGSRMEGRTVTPGQPCPTCGQIHARCAGHRRAKNGGGPCGRYPADPANGVYVCAQVHGGTSPQVLAKAKRVKTEREVRDVMRKVLGEEPPDGIDATEALLQLISWKYAEVVWLRGVVASLDEAALVWGVAEEAHTTAGEFPGTTTTRKAEANVWWRQLREAENQLASFTASAIKAGIAERRVQLAEKVGNTVIGVLRAVGLDVLTGLQSRGLPGELVAVFRELFDGAVRQHLLALPSDS